MVMLVIALGCLVVATVGKPIEQTYYNNFKAFGCVTKGSCSTVVGVLLDPRLMSSWSKQDKSVNKALKQMEAYQQLFSTDHTSEDNRIPHDVIHDDGTDTAYTKDRSKRLAPVKQPVERSSKNENMYWLIRMPGK
uniref:Pepsin-I3 domain-containing protein n=1 Tax=Panagrellus redivivus TaxID=6233 RepID=A0A7E4UZY7_PANRE